ncbi:MAG: M14 family zinc carboxypeptidase [Candidatus Bathyarchaeia archaeon]
MARERKAAIAGALVPLALTLLLFHAQPEPLFSPPVRAAPLGIDWIHYHNYTEISETLLSLNATYPAIVDVFSIGKSWQNQTIYCVRLTNEHASNPKPKVLFVGYHHARERISAELPLYFVVYAAENYGENATVRRLLDLTEIYVVVALNVDGFETVEENEWHRKTLRPLDEDGDGLFDEDLPEDEDKDGHIEELVRWNGAEWVFVRYEGADNDGDGLVNEDWKGGVDINRNYGYQWDAPAQSGSQNQSAEDYRGPAPFSEPETRAIRDLALKHNFDYAISFHSGDENIVSPWDYTGTAPPDEEAFKEVGGELSRLVSCSLLRGGEWYSTSGTWDDWMYGNQSALSFTCEIYGNDSAFEYEPCDVQNYSWRKGLTRFFNPDASEIENTVLRWMPIFFYISNKAIPAETTFLGVNWKVWLIAAAAIVGAIVSGTVLLRRRKKANLSA